MSKRDNKYSLCIPGRLSELEKLRHFVNSKAIQFGFSEEESQKITLAIDEACTNLIQYALKKDGTKEICIEIEYYQNKILINIIDNGAPFNPLDYDTPDLKEYIKRCKRGGLGIHLIKLIMDEIDYIPSQVSGSKNILKLVKLLS